MSSFPFLTVLLILPISLVLNIPGKEMSLWKLVQCPCKYQRHFINITLVIGTKMMHNQSVRILFVLTLWHFWRAGVFSGTDIPGRKQCLLDVWVKRCAFLTAVGLWLCHLVPGVCHDMPTAFRSYRAAILRALGGSHQALGILPCQ